MTDAWKLRAEVPRDVATAALVAQDEMADWPMEWVATASEIAEDRPDEWVFEVYLDRKPRRADVSMVSSLFATATPALKAEKLPDTDWVTQSQKAVAPIVAGRFHVRTPDHPRSADRIDFVIPASQAFGTGQHATTAGCLAMLDLMRRRGVQVRNLADIGTGTGLLAMAGLALWPHALATASDIDEVCAEVVADNLALNTMAQGGGRGELLMTIADGMADPLLQARGPYDLLIANILAAPLIALAPAFAASVTGGGHLVLAGLLETQEAAVRRAYFAQGFRLARRLVRGDWSILWLRRRAVR